MSDSLYFYDLETSGFNPREDRIMQFGGQRTDLNLKPIGEPDDLLIQLSEDVLPSPEAILVTGITPQQTRADGLNEAQFLKYFTESVALEGTIFVGFNSVRFDDEFMRYIHYRNFYDPYEWQWQDSRGRWDLLDVVRMTRALRPEGIQWPVDSDGKPGNRLENLASINKLEHSKAHDALSDVNVTIALARLLKNKQPKLFDYLLKMRDKKKVALLVNSNQEFVYTSGKYSAEFEKTTVVTKLVDHPKKQGALVYDLRFNPEPFLKLNPEQLIDCWTRKWQDPKPRLPVKTLQFNRCPAVAPLSVLDPGSQKRLQINKKTIDEHKLLLKNRPDFTIKLLKALDILDKKQQVSLLHSVSSVDTKLYDGFFGSADKNVMRAVRVATPNELTDFAPKLTDERLKALLPLYKARNFGKSLSTQERMAWDKFCFQKLLSGKPSKIEQYFEGLASLSKQPKLNKEQLFLLDELKLHGENIIPSSEQL